MSDKLPIGKFKRASHFSFTAAKVGLNHLAHFSKRPFLSAQQTKANLDNINTKNANSIFKMMSYLRGTALKVAQILSMESDFLPLSYQEELAKSYHQVPPLNRALIRKVMMQALGDAPENIFSAFESQAFAAASLGQVHKAQLSNGDELAIKVQYPGIAKTIQSDIQMVKALIKPLKDSDMIIPLLKEIELRLLEEVNYEQEAKNITWFANHIALKNIIVPKVYNQWTSENLLCMQLLQGEHLKAWLKHNPSQQQRNHYAQTIYDLYIHSVFELNCFHADPNPGNYLFCDKDKLGLIDFGCIKQLEPLFCRNLSKLYKAIVHQKPEAVIAIYDELNMLKNSSGNNISTEYFQEVLKPFNDWVSLPFKSETFDFAAHTGYARQGFKAMDKLRTERNNKNGYIIMHPDFVFTDRTLYGLYKIFEEMGATVRLQNNWTY